VFGISTNGTNEHVLHSFHSGTDGANPAADLTFLRGKFYGTTSGGGADDYGTIFSTDMTGKERVSYSFGERYTNDGYNPLAGLLNVNGVLYGTTEDGGISLPSCPGSGPDCDYGIVFALSP
jgi:uncharacterized repeat protein (TIGR03803 family)